MIRQPTSLARLYEWHSAVIAGVEPPRVHDDELQCGFYKRRYFRGGVWVPARVYVEREIDPLTGELTCDERLVLEVEGLRLDDEMKVLETWPFLRPITRAEFLHLTDYRLRDSRMMDAMSRVDLSDAPTPPQGA